MANSKSTATVRHFWEMTNLFNPFLHHSTSRSAVDMAWEELWSLCSFHSLRPLLVGRVNDPDRPNPLPVPTNSQHVDFERRHTFSVLQRMSEIVALSNSFQKRGTPVVFFKGAILGVQIYKGPHQREFNDIDLIVLPIDRNAAVKILQDHGFLPVIDNPIMQEAFFDYGGQQMFTNIETGTVVDFHWNFAGGQPFPITVERVIGNRIMLDVGGARVPAPSSEDLALILAGHGQKEGWAWFGWALDFAQFAARFPSLNWTEVARRARDNGSLRSLLTAMLLTNRLFAETVDNQLVEQATRQPLIVQEVEGIIDFYAAQKERDPDDDLKDSFRLCEKTEQRAKVWFQLIFRRTIGDYEAMPMPPVFWRIYHLTRPFRLLLRTIQGAQHAPSAFWRAERARVRGLMRDEGTN